MGHELDRITGFINKQFMSLMSVFLKMVLEPDRLPGKLIQLSILEFLGMTKAGLAHDPEKLDEFSRVCQ